jgi:hypothetical protein
MSRNINAFFESPKNVTKDNCDTALRYLDALQKSRCSTVFQSKSNGSFEQKSRCSTVFQLGGFEYNENGHKLSDPGAYRCMDALNQMSIISEKCLETSFGLKK